MHIKRGFTLIELLVVIAIIAILATLVLVQVESALVRSRNASAQSDISEMGKTIEVYKSDTSSDTVLLANDASLITTTGSFAAGVGAAIPSHNLYGTGNCWGTALNTGCTKLSTMFTGTEAAGSTYGTAISKTPSTSYLYGYETSSTGGDYCVATNSINTSGVSGTVGFIINDGSSVQAGSSVFGNASVPTYATTGKCS